jgi:hypothetical protein
VGEREGRVEGWRQKKREKDRTREREGEREREGDRERKRRREGEGEGEGERKRNRRGRAREQGFRHSGEGWRKILSRVVLRVLPGVKDGFRHSKGGGWICLSVTGVCHITNICGS